MTTMLDRHREALASDPENARAFAALQEHHFLAAEWPELVAVYRRRLEAPSLQADAAQRIPLLFRLAQVLEDRCLEVETAREIYWQVARLDPRHRGALRQLRQIHTRREQWDMVLQIAEIEDQIPMAPYERGVFLAEMGAVWLRGLNDQAEALSCFQRAIEADANQQQALEGLARTLETCGRHAEAVRSWEKLTQLKRGLDRAPCLVALGKLLAGPLQQADRGAECFRRALTDDPNNLAAIEALVIDAAAREQWPLLADLYQRRFDRASGARRRAAIAIEAGHMHLRRRGDAETARAWFDRALELCDDDLAVYHALAELERHCGNRTGLCTALDRIISFGAGKAAVSTLIEAADLHTEAGNDEQALAYLERAQAQRPSDPLVLEALSDALSRSGRHADLAGVLERRAALATGDPEALAESLCELGCLYDEQLSDSEAAISSLARAFDANPQMQEAATRLEELYRKTERWEDLRGLLERARGQQPSSALRARTSCSLGEVLLERIGDLAGASRAFEFALENDPASSRALRGLADIAQRTADPEALLRACEREAAVSSDPQRLAELVTRMLPLLEERQRTRDALAWLQRLLEVQPDDCGTLRSAARLQGQLGLDAARQRSLEALDRLLSGSEQAENRRGLAVLHERSGDALRAISSYEAALECDADDRESLQALVRLHAARRDHDSLARALRRLAEIVTGGPRAGCLDALSRLLEEQAADVDGAIVVLWRLCGMPERPADAVARLEVLLERAGRFEELAQQLLERRRSLPEQSAEILALDLRRASLLLDPLGQTEEAAAVFRSIRTRHPDCREATQGLEQALRSGNDSAGLAVLLESRARNESDPAARARTQFERAVILEDSLGEYEAAQEIFSALADQASEPALAASAGSRLDSLLERRGAWSTLRERLEQSLGRGSEEEDLALHRRLASLCRERLSDPEGCIEHLEAVGRLRPTEASVWQSLALLHHECGRGRDLLRVLEAELALGPAPDRELEIRSRAAHLCLETLGAVRIDATEAETLSRRAREHYERVLELAPDHAQASEYLSECYESEGRLEDVHRLLRSRLTCATDPESEALLRLRIARLLADRLGDPAAAVDVLAPAGGQPASLLLVAKPLADLYQRCGHDEALRDLCRRASNSVREPSERAVWNRRLAAAHRAAGDTRAAAEAFRSALADRPGDRELEAELRDLYRSLGESAPLAELLEAEMGRLGPREQTPLRLELAALFADRLARPEEALGLALSIVEADASETLALELATRLSQQLGRHAEMLTLLDAQLAGQPEPALHASLLERRADLLAGPFDRPDEAAAAYREALSLDPRLAGARRSLRRLLEQKQRWPALLDCLHLEAQSAEPGQRAELFEQAIAIAREHLASDAALPWLERLRGERPRDPEILARIADLHRQAGRPEALLRALEAELLLVEAPGRRREIHIDRARVLERDLRSPARAISAWEAARAIAPADGDVLAALDRLYDLTGRVRERVEVIEARIETSAPGERIPLHREAAMLWAAKLASGERAVPHLLHAVDLSRTQEGARSQEASGQETLELLRQLAECLRADHRTDAWARAAEAELASLHGQPGGSSSELLARRGELHQELARAYANDLGLPDRAAPHLRALLALADESGAQTCGALSPAFSAEWIERAELALIDLLRRERRPVELAARLATHLERRPDDADGWLELARLRAEQLQQPAAAAQAYRQALEHRPTSLAAMRGLRHVAETLCDWREVAHSLDLEIEIADTASPRERQALQRRLGEICWRRLGELARAVRAGHAALACAPRDLETLRPLAQLLAQAGQWSEAVDLYEREIEILGEQEPGRRQSLWLQVAEISRDTLADPSRALRGYEAAARIGRLQPAAGRAWADLYLSTGHPERHVQVFAEWCDDALAKATCHDHMALARCLEELGRRDEALARACRATAVAGDCAEAWELRGRLHEEQAEPRQAREALARAASLRPPAEGAGLLLRAALLVAEHDAGDAAQLLREGIALDRGNASAHARLARVACRLERFEEAEEAAARALDLAASSPLAPALLLDAALAGGASARARGRLEEAARFHAQALALEPDHREALDAQGEILHGLGEVAAAARICERRLALAGPNPARARQLAIVAIGLAHASESERALTHFAEALELEPDLAIAHAGVVGIQEAAGQHDRAIASLERWLQHDPEAHSRARSHLRLTDHLQATDQNEACEQHLRRALAEDASLEAAWQRLAERLHAAENWDGALETCEQARPHLRSPALQARLALLRARLLETRGDRPAAAAAYAEVAAADPRACDAVLARARLLRGLGEWDAAATALGDFASSHPEPTCAGLAQVQLERGRLLAGPLEDVHEAIRCYELALAIEPGLRDAREPLAALLVHVPERAQESVRQQLALLAEDPTRPSSLRALLEISRRQTAGNASRFGLSLLRALGIASPEEAAEAAESLPVRLAGNARLENPLWETARRITTLSSQEIGSALASQERRGAAAHASDAVRAFWELLREAESELCAPGLCDLTSADLSSVVYTVTALAADPGGNCNDGPFLHALDDALGRWTRRKIRKSLGEHTVRSIQSIDYDAWRADIRVLAAAAAVDRCEGDLRTALVTLATDGGRLEPREISQTADIRSLVVGSAQARRVLLRAIEVWGAEIARGA